jgi:deoxyribodipyrimidine photo-lyase
MAQMRMTVVWWIKRDARLADNACLVEADRLGAAVIPLFGVEPSMIVADDCSDMHLNAQFQAVSGLRQELRNRGADLLIAHGEMVEKIAKLHRLMPFTHLFSHEEIGNNLSFRRDRAVAAWCREQGVVYREFPQSSVRRGGVNRDRLHRQWTDRIVEPTPLPVPAIRIPDGVRPLCASTGFPKLAAFTHQASWQPVSEADAQTTLTDFLARRGYRYRGGISSPNTAFTAGSRLSVHLAWGTITVRQLWHATQERLSTLDLADPESDRWKKSLRSFVSRLHWRDHFVQRLESESELEFQSIHPSYRDVPYENNERLHFAWCRGLTGYPLVDAVMRCLAATGFVNFRMRAMVVSFACHVLHLDWRLIHPYLARVFRDYDPGIHLSQLQMQAGVVGWNAIRVYNPTKQLTDWDRDCRFVKQWLPELRGVPADRIVASDDLPNYPSPVVPFAPRAKWMTDLLYAVRKSAESKAETPAVYRRHGSRKKTRTGRKALKRPPVDRQQSLFDADSDIDTAPEILQ